MKLRFLNGKGVVAAPAFTPHVARHILALPFGDYGSRLIKPGMI
jgi:hypothetical protein